MTDIIHGSPRPLPVDNLFFRWWQSVDQWTLLATLGLIVVGLLLSMAASVPLADSNDKPMFYYVYRQVIYAVISLSLIIFLYIGQDFSCAPFIYPVDIKNSLHISFPTNLNSFLNTDNHPLKVSGWCISKKLLKLLCFSVIETIFLKNTKLI